ncbi:hypothetical protein [Streptomyces sp. NPDC012756]|uniref:hypothetical protein n=1 Tax=Streptomyces sp. NPDC012756 TaxID=3364847 RepID=UPI00368D46DB
MKRTCEMCPNELPLMARSHARTCSPRCRKALSRAAKNTLPDELTTRDRWVRRAADKRPLTVDGTAVEIYGTGRYIAMTGRRHGNAPSILADLSAAVSALLI